jgi:hypothetical protein
MKRMRASRLVEWWRLATPAAPKHAGAVTPGVAHAAHDMPDGTVHPRRLKVDTEINITNI